MLVTLLKTFDSSTQLHMLANISQVHLIICLVANYGVGPNARRVLSRANASSYGV
jgi:hypothetical protein